MRILVCGGRNFNDRDKLVRVLDKFCEDRELNTPIDKRPPCGNYMPENVTIIAGKARGADTMAAEWAVVNWTGLEEYPADWNKYGKAAGYIRNKQMLDEGKPDVVIAFPGGAGTKMMCKIAREAGVEVIEIE